MAEDLKNDAVVVVIFGARGDLTWRKLVPALYNLFLDNWLPDRFIMLGVDRKAMTHQEFIERLHDGTQKFSRRKIDEERWNDFASHLGLFVAGDFANPDCYKKLKQQLEEQDKEWNVKATRVYYLAIPPNMIETVTRQLGQADLSHDRGRSRIVVEKPFGRDLASAQALNRTLTSVFEESQIYRIDHYLGKETVQNIIALRFANALFEPLWDRRYIDHVQITVAERVGVEHRGSYYEKAGALRDMIQNHLMQILCLIAMEPPVSLKDEEIRNKKVDVVRAIRQIPQDNVHRFAVRGQYGSGWIEGQYFPAYREEDGVNPDSNTETFAAVKLFVDNWRWQGVPFYLRTGKRLPVRISEAFIQFRPVPHQSFPSMLIGDWQPNRLGIRIQPNEGVMLRFQAKQPGLKMRLSPVDMRFSYSEAFKAKPPEAYETLLLDVMQGDATLFMRADQAETAWAVVKPIQDSWEAVAPPDFPNYPAGSWGPETAEVLIAQDGRSWLQPTLLEAPEKTGPKSKRKTRAEVEAEMEAESASS